MTVDEAINRLDGRCSNSADRESKLLWLSTLDGQIYREILKPWGLDTSGFTGYGSETEGTRELLVGPPFEEMYLYYMERELALLHREINRYNDASVLFHSLYSRFLQEISRENDWPKKTVFTV